MRNENLAVYLNDHLAGSVAALELIDHMITASSGTELENFFKEIHEEIQQDQNTLEQLMAELCIQQSSVRKTSAWIMEKAALIKLGPDLKKDGGFGLFQSLEGLALGIKGKEKLWQALALRIPPGSMPKNFDLPLLEKRADRQHAKVEQQRLLAASKALRG